MSPRPLLAVVAAICALLVHAAVAWACTPQAAVATDKLSYTSGEQMTVSGRDFSGTTVTITTDPAGASAGPVPVSSTGAFEARLDAPDQPGSYALVATSSNGWAARTAFEVRPPPPIRGRITAVVDGDTIKVRTASGNIVVVRLLGIDAPEMGARECGAAGATASMRGMSFVRLADGHLRGRGVTLTTDPSQRRRDRYGRLLAYAATDAGMELGYRQVRRGWGKVYVFQTAFERLTSYRNAQAAARSERRGVWGVCGGDFHH